MDLLDKSAEVTRAREEYRRSLEVVQAEHREATRRAKISMVGHCFRAVEALATDRSRTWPVYIAIEGMDAQERLLGWYFQHTVTGDAQVREADDLQAGFLSEHCTEIERDEFVAAFNELLTHTARFASRIPTR